MIARLRETEWSDEVTRQTGRRWAEEIPGANVARPLTDKGEHPKFLRFIRS